MYCFFFSISCQRKLLPWLVAMVIWMDSPCLTRTMVVFIYSYYFTCEIELMTIRSNRLFWINCFARDALVLGARSRLQPCVYVLCAFLFQTNCMLLKSPPLNLLWQHHWLESGIIFLHQWCSTCMLSTISILSWKALLLVENNMRQCSKIYSVKQKFVVETVCTQC